MADVTSCLRKHDRKERIWLIRGVLGSANLALSRDFVSCLQRKINQPGFQPSWWTTDFHIYWLAQALQEFSPTTPARVSGLANTPGDFDLILADGKNIVVCEAKNEGAWSTEQLKTKVSLINQILKCDDAPIIMGADGNPVRIHLVLLGLEGKKPKYLKDCIPWVDWMRGPDGEPNFMPLAAHSSDDPVQGRPGPC